MTRRIRGSVAQWGVILIFAFLGTACRDHVAGSRYQSSSGVASDGWRTHQDQTFFVSGPPGWRINADRRLGQVELAGTSSERVVIWPVFIPGTLGNAAASAVLRGLAAKVWPEAEWKAPDAAGGNAVRMVGRAGDKIAVSALRVSPASKGSAGIMYLVCAPATKYSQIEETISRILASFRYWGGQTSEGGRTRQYVRWQDPNEGAFSVEIPQGWRAQGGAIRPHLLTVQAKAEMRSEDGEIFVYLGDNFPVYVEPNQVLAFAGVGPGGVYTDPMGGRSPVQYYVPGTRYVTSYILPQRGGSFQVLSQKDRPDVARSLITLGINQYDAGEVDYRLQRNGKRYRGAALCITEVLSGGIGRMWHVWRLYLAEAPEARFSEAEEALVRAAQSFRINPQWAQMQAKLTAQQVGIITEMGNTVSHTIRQTYEGKWKVMDEIDRRRSNANLGIEDVIDPLTGREFQVESGSDYYWTDPRGRVVGTQTDANPDPDTDFRQLIRLR